MTGAGWNFNNTYANLPEILLSRVSPQVAASPKLVVFNESLSKKLGLDFTNADVASLSQIFSGNVLPRGSDAIAQAYAGHQFGFFTVLGDGRAILLGEQLNKKNVRYDIQLKGSGKTPYSRSGDGRAALGPVLREYLISESMYKLGIPTTRSLAVVTTGDSVYRERKHPGAILTRVASSHLRVGTYQFALLKGGANVLEKLLDYGIERHYPNLINSKNRALSFLASVINKQINLIVGWMRVGFIHGVMNTDNMAISGETIDYGPCAFMDNYNPNTFYSSIDLAGRYSYINQPKIAHWNLIRFAEALLPLINSDQTKAISAVKEVFEGFEKTFKESWTKALLNKIGLNEKNTTNEKILNKLLLLMENKNADYTNTFLYLTYNKFGDNSFFREGDFIEWHNHWKSVLGNDETKLSVSFDLMKKNNPSVIPRNYLVEEVLKEAENKNFDPFKKLLKALENPYQKNEDLLIYQRPPKDGGADYKTFCGT
mgnify:CR=1 FL=1